VRSLSCAVEFLPHQAAEAFREFGYEAREHASLARHLERSIDTGLWCVYRPEQPVRWRL